MLKVLIAVDGSEYSHRAIEAVAKLAALTAPLNVVLLNVRDGAKRAGDLPALDPAQYEQAQRQLQDDLLADELAHARACGLTVGSTRRAEGAAAQEIVQVAAECGADQIVIGTRGKGALGSLLMGSVAQRVVQLSTVPVLIVK